MTPDLAAYLRDYLPERKDPPPRRPLRPEEVSQPAWLPRYPGDVPTF